MSSRALPATRSPVFRHGGAVPLFFPPRIRHAEPVSAPAVDQASRAYQAVELVQDRLRTGEVEVRDYPGGARGEVAIPAGELLLILDPARQGMRTVPSRDERAFAWCSRVAGVGAALLALGWAAVLFALLTGLPLALPTMMAASGVIIFIGPLGLSSAMTREPVPVTSEHPQALEVELTLRAALARGPLG